MKTSILLIAYRGDRWLPACVKSLAEASTCSQHLVLVDNAGNTIIDDLALSGFNAEVLSTPRPMGFAEANNFALLEASHLEETVLFLNQDTISPPGWIDACTRVLESHPRLGALSPCIRTYDDDGWDPTFLACLSERQETAIKEGSPTQRLISTRKVPAPALLVPTNVLEKTGPFDPVYGSYYEDYDLCRRIREHGYTTGFYTNARIRHFSGGSTITDEQERRRMRQALRNRMLYRVREANTSRWWKAVSWILSDFPYRLARGLLGTPSSQSPTVTLQAYWDVLQLGRRLVSPSYDQRRWNHYLDEVGWPPSNSKNPNMHESSPRK